MPGADAPLPVHRSSLTIVFTFLKQIFASMWPRIPSTPQPPPEPAALRKTDVVLFQQTGPCSWFGGPADTGVRPDEGLALWEPHELPLAPPGLFLRQQPAGTTGLARRLNPDAHYVACRWDYAALERRGLPRGILRACQVAVRRPDRPELGTVWAWPADWGPNQRTRRAADLSPGLMKALQLRTDDVVTVTLYAPR